MNTLNNFIKKLKEKGKFYRVRKEVILALAGIVVFVTTYALILPALTMDTREIQNQAGIDFEPEVGDEEILGEEAFDDAGDDGEDGLGQTQAQADQADDGNGVLAEADLIEDADGWAEGGLFEDDDAFTATLDADAPRAGELAEESLSEDTAIAGSSADDGLFEDEDAAGAAGEGNADSAGSIGALFADDDSNDAGENGSGTETQAQAADDDTQAGAVGIGAALGADLIEDEGQDDPVLETEAAEVAADPESKSDVAEALTDTQPASEIETEADAKVETEAGTETGTEAGTEGGTESETELGTETAAEPETTAAPAIEEMTESLSERMTEEAGPEIATEDLTEEEKEEETEPVPETVNLTEDGLFVKGDLPAYKGTDYTVRVSCGEEAQVPANARVEVREIDPEKDREEYLQYYEATKQAMGLGPDEELPSEQARFFDITILAENENGELVEIEPKAAVSVQIQYDEGLDVSNKEDVNALHFAKGEEKPEVLELQDVQTKEDEQAVTSLAFDANSFSVYGVVYSVKAEVEGGASSVLGGTGATLTQIAEELGLYDDGVLSRDNMGAIRSVTSSDDTLVRVSKIDGEDDWMIESVIPEDEADSFTGEKSVTVTVETLSKMITIEIVITGQAQVSADSKTGVEAVIESVDGLLLPEEAEGYADVVIGKKAERAVDAVEEATGTQSEEESAGSGIVMAVEKETGSGEDAETSHTEYQVLDISLQNVNENAYENGFKVNVILPERVAGRDFRLYHLHDGKTEEITDLELNSSSFGSDYEIVGGFSFETTGFSQFVLRYTVDFYYKDNGKHIEGGTQILLSQLIVELDIRNGEELLDVADVASVEFTDDHLVEVEEVSGEVLVNQEMVDVGDKDFLLTSLQPFSSYEKLTIRLTDGTVIVVNVEDAQQFGTEFTLHANLTGAPSNQSYYALISMDTPNGIAYKLQPLTVGETTISFADLFVLYQGDKQYGYGAGTNVKVQLIASDSSSLSMDNIMYNGNMYNRYADGSFVSGNRVVRTAQNAENLSLYLEEKNLGTGIEHRVDTYFYQADKTTAAPANPGFESSRVYYIVSTLTMKGSSQPTAYRITAFNKTYSNNCYTSTVGNTFTIMDVSGKSLSETVAYDPSVFDREDRIYHRSGNGIPTTYQDATNEGASDLMPGYDFMSNEIKSNALTEIRLHAAFEKDYTIKLEFNTTSPSISADDHVYLFATYYHRTTGTEYYIRQIDDVAFGLTEKAYKVDDGKGRWYNKDKSAIQTPALTGYESVSLRLVKADRALTDNEIFNDNTPKLQEGDYLIGNNISYSKPRSREEVGTSTKIADYITFNNVNVSNDYDYMAILGAGASFGITANIFEQPIHIQSNFATNFYYGGTADIEPDLAGKGAVIVIADYNVNNGIALKIGNSRVGDSNTVVYLGKYGTRALLANENERNWVHVIPSDTEELTNSIVNPILAHASQVSTELLTHETSLHPRGDSNQEVYLDLLDLPETATIYLDGDELAYNIGEAGKLYITKHKNQTIVFNYNSTTKATVNQYHVRYAEGEDPTYHNGEGGSYFKTESPQGKGDPKNTFNDTLSRHMIFNLNSVKDVKIQNTVGIFLVPREDSYVTVPGTSAGWIVCGGTFKNTAGEWHSVYSDMPDSTTTNLTVKKTVDGLIPNGNQVFNFELSHLDASKNWESVETKQNTNGVVAFNGIEQLHVGWNIYRIVEDATVPETTNATGIYTADRRQIYAVVLVEQLTLNGKLAMIARTPSYFIQDNQAGTVWFDKDKWTVNASSLAGAFGNADSGIKLSPVNTPTFENETAKDKLVVTKTVEGTTAADKEFEFVIRLEELADASHPGQEWMPCNNNRNMTVLITGADSTATTPTVFTLDQNGEYTFKLKNGQKAAFNELPDKFRYMVYEKKVTMPGYSIVSGPGQEDYVIVEENSTGSAAFVNRYHAEGSIRLQAHKELQKIDDHAIVRPLEPNQFGFELQRDGITLQTKYNDASGVVSFEDIVYSEADMTGAELNADGTRSKVIYYTVHEIEGTVSDDQIAVYNAEDQTIAVLLTDNGDGTITAVLQPEDAQATFINYYSETTNINVTKVWQNNSGENVPWPADVTVTVQLMHAVGEQTPVAVEGKTAVLSAGQPTYTFEKLPIFNAEGQQISYSIEEIQISGNVQDYTSEITGDASTGFTVTNIDENSTSIEFEKAWSDGNDRHSEDSVTVQLYKYVEPAGEPETNASNGTGGSGETETNGSGTSQGSESQDQSHTTTVRVVWTIDPSVPQGSWTKVWSQQAPIRGDGIDWGDKSNQNWHEVYPNSSSYEYQYSFEGVSSEGVQQDYIVEPGFDVAGNYNSADFSIVRTSTQESFPYKRLPIVRGNAVEEDVCFTLKYNGTGSASNPQGGNNEAGTTFTIDDSSGIPYWMHLFNCDYEAAASNRNNLSEGTLYLYKVNGSNNQSEIAKEDWNSATGDIQYQIQSDEPILGYCLQIGNDNVSFVISGEGVIKVSKNYYLFPSTTNRVTISYSTSTASLNGQTDLLPLRQIDRNYVALTEPVTTANSRHGFVLTDVPTYITTGAVPVDGRTCVLNAGNNWSGSFTDLPLYENGRKVSYFVMEVAADTTERVVSIDNVSYEVKESRSDESIKKVLITNTVPAPGSLKITKTTVGAGFNDLTYTQKDNITFTVTGPYNYSKVIRLSEFSGSEYTIDGLYAGTYQVEEENAASNVPDSYSFVGTAYVSSGEENASAVVPAGGTAEITVTNTYLRHATYNPKVTKTLSGRDWENNDSFTFVLTQGSEQDGVVMPTGGTQATVTRDTPNHTASFGAITFTKAGIYYFNVTEQVPKDATGNKLNGVTYDGNAKTIEVEITEDPTSHKLTVARIKLGKGEDITEATAIESAAAQVENHYSTTDTSYAPKVTKQLLRAGVQSESARWPAAGFTFTLSSAGNNAASGWKMNENETSAEIETSTETETETATATEAIPDATFTPITFSAAGTYTFVITETVPNGAVNADGTTYVSAENKTGLFFLNGYAYDATPIPVEVIVEDQKDGTLAVTSVKYGDGDAVTTGIDTATGSVTNYFDETKAHAEGTKILTGRDWQEGETFTFTLTPEEPTAALIGTALLLPETDTQTGVVVSNDHVITVTAAKPTTGNEQTFVFPKITFRDAGTYTFVMAEAQPDAQEGTKGLTYSAKQVRVTFEVSRDANANGKLTVETPTYEVIQPDHGSAADPTSSADSSTDAGTTTEEGTVVGNEPETNGSGDALQAAATVFVNEYHAEDSIVFTAEKTLVGGDLEEDTFTFSLTQVKGNGEETQATASEETPLKLPQSVDMTTQKQHGQTQTVTFDRINFTQADAGKTFWFMIKEKLPDDIDATNVSGNILYDTHKEWIRVVVTDDLQGHLNITKTPGNAGETTVNSGVQGVQQGTESNSETHAETDVDATFVNRKLTAVYAKKVWKQGETVMTAWPENQTVTFQLQEKQTGANGDVWTPVAADILGNSITEKTIKGRDEEPVSFVSLPAEKEYRVIETKVNDKSLETPILAFGVGNGTPEKPLEVENVIPLTELSGKKIWNDGEEHTNYNDEIILALSRQSTDSKGQVHEETVYDVKDPSTLLQPEWLTNDAGVQTGEFIYRNLPKYDNNGNEYTYSVMESGFKVGTGENAKVYTVIKKIDAGKESFEVKDGDTVVTKFGVTQTGNEITNTEYTELYFEKEWTKGDTTPVAWPDETGAAIFVTLRLQLYEKGADTTNDPINTYEKTYAINKSNHVNFEDNSTWPGNNLLDHYQLTPEIIQDGEKPIYRYKITGLAKTRLERNTLCKCVYSISEAQVEGYNLPVYSVVDKNSASLTEDQLKANEFSAKKEYGEIIDNDAKEYKSPMNGSQIFVKLKDGDIITISNRKITVALPATGGIGTTIFYVGGAILLIAALILLVTKRRAGGKDEVNDKE